MLITKSKLVIVILIILLVIALIYGKGLLGDKQTAVEKAAPEATQAPDSSSAEIISTNPNPLDNAVIPADQIIEFTFNKPLRAPSEFKLRIEPETVHKIELSTDRKTARIVTEKPYELNTNYALYIGAETKFDGIDRWGKDVTYRFQTIKFRGL